MYRTFPIKGVYDTTVSIGQHLHLDVARPCDHSLKVNSSVTESRTSFRLCGGQHLGQLVRRGNPPDTAPTATSRSLHKQGIADTLGLGESVVDARDRSTAGNDRHSRSFRHDTRGGFVTHHFDRPW